MGLGEMVTESGDRIGEAIILRDELDYMVDELKMMKLELSTGNTLNVNQRCDVLIAKVRKLKKELKLPS